MGCCGNRTWLAYRCATAVLLFVVGTAPCTAISENCENNGNHARDGCIDNNERAKLDLRNELLRAIDESTSDAAPPSTAHAGSKSSTHGYFSSDGYINENGGGSTSGMQATIISSHRPEPEGLAQPVQPGDCKLVPADGRSKYPFTRECGPPVNEAEKLYVKLLDQIKASSNVDMKKLLSSSACHLIPRSRLAWRHAANAEVELGFPNFWLYLRTKLIVALLESEPEWWEEKGDAESEQLMPGESLAVVRRSVVQKRADAFFGKPLTLLKASLVKVTTVDTRSPMQTSEIAARLKTCDALLRDISPALVEWVACGSTAFPPLASDVVSSASPRHSFWETRADNEATSKPDHGGKTRHSDIPGGEMVAMFSTPLYVVNLVDNGVVSDLANSRMSAQVLAAYDKYVTSQAAVDPDTGDARPPAVLNNVFWKVQQRGTQLTPSIPEAVEISHHMLEAARVYLKSWGMAPETMPTEDFFGNHSWFSIHGNGSTHVPHIHFDCRLAAVYYAQVPEGDGGGRLIFHDPRDLHFGEKYSTGCKGADCSVPPPDALFAGNRHYHTPRAGDLVVFPGWLYHSVEGVVSEADEYRVSLSFNVEGYWTDTVP